MNPIVLKKGINSFVLNGEIITNDNITDDKVIAYMAVNINRGIIFREPYDSYFAKKAAEYRSNNPIFIQDNNELNNSDIAVRKFPERIPAIIVMQIIDDMGYDITTPSKVGIESLISTFVDDDRNTFNNRISQYLETL